MRVLSLNIARPVEIPWRGQMIRTGIYKEPVDGPRRITRLRIEGDLHADLTVHGGLDKAVYGYPAENYPYWQERLCEEAFPYGQFGENLTTEGMPESEVFLGDVYRVGTALLQVSEPRQPCYKLAYRMARPDFPAQFLASGRVGYYFRVLEEGLVQAGDPIERVETDPGQVSLSAVAELLYGGVADPLLIERALAIQSLSPKMRGRLEKRLRGLAGETPEES